MTENVNFVDKEIKPPYVSQASPIESFWGKLDQKVYDNVWEAKTRKQLIACIKLKLKDFDSKYLQTLMRNAKTNLRKIANEGVYSAFKNLSFYCLLIAFLK